MKVLRYILAYDSPKKHPQVVLNEMGVTYQYAIPQSIADQWWFINFENLPSELPSYMEVLEKDVNYFLGHGLNSNQISNLKEQEIIDKWLSEIDYQTSFIGNSLADITVFDDEKELFVRALESEKKRLKLIKQ